MWTSLNMPEGKGYARGEGLYCDIPGEQVLTYPGQGPVKGERLGCCIVGVSWTSLNMSRGQSLVRGWGRGRVPIQWGLPWIYLLVVALYFHVVFFYPGANPRFTWWSRGTNQSGYHRNNRQQHVLWYTRVHHQSLAGQSRARGTPTTVFLFQSR